MSIPPYLKNWLGWVAVLIAPVVYYIYVAQLALNLPLGDDFVVLINYLMRSDAAPSWAVKWHELSFQFIEHRLVFSRLLAQAIRGVGGSLDFRWMILIGNFCLLGVVGLFQRALRANGLSVWYLLPVVLIVFQPIAYESHFWPLSATNYMPVCLFALVAFYGLDRGTGAGFSGALLLAVVATYTFGNGLLVWPVGALVLLLTQRWRMLAVWLGSAGFIICAYYYGHNYHPQPSMVTNLQERFGLVVANFFLLVGACFNPADTLHPLGLGDVPALVAGVATVAVVLLTGLQMAASHRRWGTGLVNTRLATARYGIFLWATALFLLLSCAAFAVGRSTINGVVTDSRYRDFSVFTTALAYCLLLLALRPAHRRSWLGLATGAGLLFCVSSYALYTPRLLDQNANFKAGADNWHRNRHWLIYKQASYFNVVVDRISADLEKVSWYRIPVYFTGSSTLSDIHIEGPTTLDTQNQVAYWRLPVDPVGSNQPYYRMQNGKQTYILALKRPTNLTTWVRTGNAVGPYFITDFAYGHMLLPGQWTISILLEPAHKHLTFAPPLTLTVPKEIH